MDNELYTCKNCCSIFSGSYCNNCGEKAFTEKDKKISHFFSELFHFSTHLDGKFFTTIKTIFTRPGKLSYDYCNGIRKKYFKPLSLFLLIIIIYLLFPLAKGLNMNYNTYVSSEYNYAWYARPIANNKISKKNIKIEEFAGKYDKKSQVFAKPFLLLLLPLSALALAGLFYKKRKYFFDHFVLGIEITSSIITFMFLIVPLLAYIIMHIYPVSKIIFKDGSILDYVVLILLLIMVSFALKNFMAKVGFGLF
jgi:hypothetical protein